MKQRTDLIKKADKLFSIHIRTRGENFGRNICYTCNRSYEWKDMDAGHFIVRRYLNTRWHPLNVWPQCQECNREKSGNVEVFEAKLRAQFGDEAIDALIWLARSFQTVTDEDIKNIINLYKSP